MSTPSHSLKLESLQNSSFHGSEIYGDKVFGSLESEVVWLHLIDSIFNLTDFSNSGYPLGEL